MKCNNIKLTSGKGRKSYVSYLLMIFTMIFLLVGCSTNNDKANDNTGNNTGNNTGSTTGNNTGDNTGKEQVDGDKETDGTSTASIVDKEADFIKSVSADGNWITAITKDLTIAEEVVVDGTFVNGKKDESGNDIVQRKLALYSQDADRNITARYTLTIPTLRIKSPNASLQHGYFIGDVLVEAEGFQLIDNSVEGNIYFSSEEVKNSFTMDETSTVSGVQEVKQ